MFVSFTNIKQHRTSWREKEILLVYLLLISNNTEHVEGKRKCFSCIFYKYQTTPNKLKGKGNAFGVSFTNIKQHRTRWREKEFFLVYLFQMSNNTEHVVRKRKCFYRIFYKYQATSNMLKGKGNAFSVSFSNIKQHRACREKDMLLVYLLQISNNTQQVEGKRKSF